MAQISFRMDDDLKVAAETTFKRMGMTLSTAVTVFVTQTVRTQKFPFAIETGENPSEADADRLKE